MRKCYPFSCSPSSFCLSLFIAVSRSTSLSSIPTTASGWVSHHHMVVHISLSLSFLHITCLSNFILLSPYSISILVFCPILRPSTCEVQPLHVTEPIPIADWLYSYKLNDYVPLFEAAGYDATDFLQSATSDDLMEIGVTKPGHKKKILSALSSLRHKEHLIMSKPVSWYHLKPSMLFLSLHILSPYLISFSLPYLFPSLFHISFPSLFHISFPSLPSISHFLLSLPYLISFSPFHISFPSLSSVSHFLLSSVSHFLLSLPYLMSFPLS